jgi:hypothetical protein
MVKLIYFHFKHKKGFKFNNFEDSKSNGKNSDKHDNILKSGDSNTIMKRLDFFVLQIARVCAR